MDKTSLLHELVRPSRIEKERKTLQTSVIEDDAQKGQTFEQEVFKKKELEIGANCQSNHGVIFVNPNKINSFTQTDRLKSAQLMNHYSSQNTKSSQSVSKKNIYINPNFKNSVLSSFHNERKESPTNASCKNTTVHTVTSHFNKQINKPENCVKNKESYHEDSKNPADSCFANKMQKIYVNQHFTKRVGASANSVERLCQKLSDKSPETANTYKNLSPSSEFVKNCAKSSHYIEIKRNNPEVSSDFLKKPIAHASQDYKAKEFLTGESTKKYISSTMHEKKVFLNPNFRKRLAGSKTAYASSFRSNLTGESSSTAVDTVIKKRWLNTTSKDNTIDGNQDLWSLKSTLPVDYGQSMTMKNTKVAGQRKRTVSTCLVSVSATKIVRRRKSNLKVALNMSGSPSSNKLLFLSKTKLVRNALLKNTPSNNNFVNNKDTQNYLSLKSKLKSLNSKNNLHEKLSKCRRQSFPSGSNMVDIVSKSGCVTKIKSNNEKSLQLVKQHEGLTESVIPSRPSGTNNLNQSLFISKTKLIRKSGLHKQMNIDNAIVKNVANTDNELKSKTKLALRKRQLQYLTLCKINNQRKQNASSSTHILNNVPKLACATKIRSNNGRSLKLIPNNEIPLRYLKGCTSERLSTVLKRKQLLRQQINKNMMGLFRSKSRKTQFSKINVSVEQTSSQTPCQSKYVYKNKDILSKRQLTTKAAILKRRRSSVRVQASLSTDKTKYVKSKYKLMRKYLHYSNNSAIKGNKDKPPSKPENSLKMKWRMLNGSSKKHCKRKELSIVNIGGVFYRCSRTSLTKNKPRPKQVLQKNTDGTILHVHGQKFKLERNGLTLTCLDKNPRRKRVDIGGVTFISSSSGTSLTQTNYHTARSILVHAKQKSIHLLTRKLKKNNEPCLFFHRFGKCSGKERGICVRQHDKKNIAVCKKFVQGSCSDAQCLLSHTISCHNMPTCQHFLAGHCSRDNCLYPHIKVSDSAPICLDFLKGYCQLGDQCTKRHRDICPSFEKGVCPRGKYCPYPHPKAKSGKSLSRLTILRKQNQSRDAEVVSNAKLRYFDDVNLQQENNQRSEEDHNLLEEENVSEEEEGRRLFRNRPKLGRLPSFIPLTDDDFCS